jgi:2-C-methyl-D-erythritol 2,4-cyclodiphosphate synthase
MRVGFGYDSHRLENNRKLVLGGVEIPFNKGCIAHSDGDVVIHAICDALLGAAGMKDIGTLFPDSDPEFKNIDSKLLLAKTVDILSRKGMQVNNADITIILESPKLSPYIDSMISILSPIMKIDHSDLAIKAKTNEKMGFIGAGEGVVAVAIVSVND